MPQSIGKADRQTLIEAMLDKLPFMASSQIKGELSSLGIDVTLRTVQTDMSEIRRRWAEKPEIYEMFGQVVRVLQMIVHKAYEAGELNNAVGAVKQLDKMLHLSEVIESKVDHFRKDFLDIFQANVPEILESRKKDETNPQAQTVASELASSNTTVPANDAVQTTN